VRDDSPLAARSTKLNLVREARLTSLQTKIRSVPTLTSIILWIERTGGNDQPLTPFTAPSCPRHHLPVPREESGTHKATFFTTRRLIVRRTKNTAIFKDLLTCNGCSSRLRRHRSS